MELIYKLRAMDEFQKLINSECGRNLQNIFYINLFDITPTTNSIRHDKIYYFVLYVKCRGISSKFLSI
jgi:hypothetical protein